MIDLDALKRKAKAATEPREWYLVKDQDGPRYVMAGTVPIANVYSSEFADAEHIAAANPATVLALIERIREAERRLAKMCDLHMEGKQRRMAAEEREVPSRAMSLDAPTNSGCTCQGLSFYSPACHPACPAAKAKP